MVNLLKIVNLYIFTNPGREMETTTFGCDGSFPFGDYRS